MSSMLETAFSFVAVGLGVLYVSALLILHAGLRKLAARVSVENATFSSDTLPYVSLIVSARNEERNIGRLISCLVSQEYPREKMEILIVDDRSTDGTWSALQTAERTYPVLKALRITDTQQGFAPKKRALDLAIRTARGEILLFTDADCTPSPTWAQAIVGLYHDNAAGVIGYSSYRFDAPTPALLKGMLALDYFSLFTVAAASSGLGRALTASGTNLSYRKQTYVDIGGFESMKQWISGDDDLLIHEVERKNAGTFSFALDPRAYVPAAAPESWRQFWNQRIRFASKGKHYGGTMTAGLIGVYLVNLAIVGGLIGLLFGQTFFFWMAAALWGAKSLAELVFLSQAAQLLQERRLLKYFLPTALLHPLYITLFGFLGLFATFQWKEGEFKKKLN